MSKEITIEFINEVAFKIISSAGEAKSDAMMAIFDAKEGKFEDAAEKLKSANKNINLASESHFELIQAEARGEKVEIPLILLHAEDQLLSTQTIILLAEEIIDLHKRIKG